MLEQYASPEKQKIELKVKLTPEEKLNFKETQESDPKYLDASRKLEESLLANKTIFNGSKFRFTVPVKKKKSEAKSIDATVVDLDSSSDAFDKLVATGRNSPTAANNDSVDDQINTTPANNNSKPLSLKSTDQSPIKESSLFGFCKISEKSESESVVMTKPSNSGKNTKFVFRTPRTANNHEMKEVVSEINKSSSTTSVLRNEAVTEQNEIISSTSKSRKDVNKPSSSTTSLKNYNHDKYDTDTVLKELSDQNHLPVGANRTRPNSPLRNTIEKPNKKINRTEVQQKQNDTENDSHSSSTSKLSSSTYTSISLSSSLNNSIDTTCTIQPKTGFENLPNVLSQISSSSALKVTTNVSSTNLLDPFTK